MKDTSKTEPKAAVGRRDFLRGVGVGAGAAGIAAIAASSGGEPAKAADRPTSPGYRETEHVRRFYQLARF